MTAIDLLPLNSEGFAGHVSPSTVCSHLNNNQNAYLVDVRSKAEWAFVGTPDVQQAKRRIVFVEWQLFPNMVANENFTSAFSTAIPDRDAPIFFLCRSGVRSQAAAQCMTQAGYVNCFNVAGGFEGDGDEHGQRGHVNGWKKEGCPWRQS